MGGKGFSSKVVMTNIEHPEKTVQLSGCMHKICQHKEKKNVKCKPQDSKK